jgi:hypothetical protein
MNSFKIVRYLWEVLEKWFDSQVFMGGVGKVVCKLVDEIFLVKHSVR